MPTFEPEKTKVTLVSWTPSPEALMFSMWHSSRSDGDLVTVADVVDEMDQDHLIRRHYTEVPKKFDHSFLQSLTNTIKKPNDEISFTDIVINLFKEIIASNIPVCEALTFTFILEDMPVYYREQLVRDRDGSYWSMTSRARDINTFADKGLYQVPKGIKDNPLLLAQYRRIMKGNQDFMQLAKDQGVHQDDYRGVLPSTYSHRMSMHFNLRDLIDLIQTRCCWVVQNNLWGPVIKGISEEFKSKVSPYLAAVTRPKCFKGDTFAGCVYPSDLQIRMSNRDPAAPCPLWLKERGKTLHEMEPNLAKEAEFKRLSVSYGDLWNYDLDAFKPRV